MISKKERYLNLDNSEIEDKQRICKLSNQNKIGNKINVLFDCLYYQENADIVFEFIPLVSVPRLNPPLKVPRENLTCRSTTWWKGCGFSTSLMYIT